MPQAARQIGDFIPAPLCSEIMKEAPRNCTCQICQGLKARGDHFDSFQQPFCWSSMLLLHCVPGEVMGEQWIMCFRINSKGSLKCIVAFRQVWKSWLYILVRLVFRERWRERDWLNTRWICIEQTIWSYSGLFSHFLFSCCGFDSQIEVSFLTPTWS